MTLDSPFSRIDDKLVYFQTFSGRSYSDSPKAMYEYMLKAPEYSDYRFVWCFKEPEKYSRLPENERTRIVKFRTKADNIALRRAKYWISNYRMHNHQYPRNDRLVNVSGEERNKIRDSLGVGDKKVILYAPAWRDNQHTSGQGYTYKTEVDFDKLQRELGDEYVILFRAHYLVAGSFDFGRYKNFAVDMSSYGDINDLYIASDILVTDYSSVFFDFSILERPIIFYMYDLEHYANEMRGFYLSTDELPGPIVRDEDALISSIKSAYGTQPDERYIAFKKRFNPYEDGNSSKRVLARVIDSKGR